MQHPADWARDRDFWPYELVIAGAKIISQAQHVYGYAATGMTYTLFEVHSPLDCAAEDRAMSLHCAFTVLALEAPE